MNELAQRLKRLDPAKRSMLIDRMRAQGAEIPLGLYPYLRGEQPPLADNQVRLFFLREIDVHDGVGFHIPTTVRLRGLLDIPRLERAINEMVARHEPLRTAFVVGSNGEPYQKISETLFVQIPSIDLSDESETEQAARKALRDEQSRVFDFGSAPLFRTLLLKLGSDDHVLSVVFHHIISDGWSAQVFVRDLITLYEQDTSSTSASLPELHLQPADYAMWMGEQSQRYKKYWCDTLTEMRPSHVPPMAPALPNSEGKGEVIFELGPELTESIRAMALRLGCTPFVVLYGALTLVVAKYAGHSDVTLGTTVAGRERVELENLVGYFSTAIPLRSSVRPDETVEEYVRKTRDVVLGAFDHQAHVPFEELTHELGLSRDSGRNPFFETMFVFQNYAQESMSMEELVVEEFGVNSKPEEGVATFDLHMIINDSDAFDGALLFRLSRYSEGPIRAMTETFKSVLRAFVTDVTRPLGSLQLDAEISDEWEIGPTATSGMETIMSPFWEQVAEQPTAPALYWNHDVWSYAELGRRVDEVAAELRAAGVQPGARVGVCVQRSPELIAALLGVLHIGAAYVPLEPELPSKRLEFLVSDSGMELVVLDHTGVEAADWPAGLKQLTLDEVSTVGHIPSLAIPDQLAYVIYTSGTTGNPKGVAVPHSAVMNHIRSKIAVCDYRGGERFLCRSSFAFDMSVTEMFCPLITGGSLVIAKSGGQRDPEYISELVQRHRVQVMEVVPSGLEMLLELPGFAECQSLEKVVLGGEALSNQLRDKFLDTLSGTRLFNPYGPTETTVEATTIECLKGAPVTIGRPMHNLTATVRDEFLGRVEPLVSGELFVGGVGLAWGYHANPRRTAVAFVPSFDQNTIGGRMYRTGDLVRWNEDGEIEYVGRRDHQLQIRGVRIELEEVETVIRSIPGVGDVVIVPVNEVDGRAESLVAYVVPS